MKMGNYNMSEDLTVLDKLIIETAKESFLEKGIIKTEMKELASAIGISRSSLYRHFASSIDIAFYVVPEVLDYLTHINDPIPEGLNGFEQFSFYMRGLVDNLCANLNMIRLIQEFNTLYNLKESEMDTPMHYAKFYERTNQMDSVTYFRRGLEDGTIHSVLDEVKVPLTFIFTAMSLVEHIMLREENYLREHGASREFIDYTVALMLSGIKA